MLPGNTILIVYQEEIKPKEKPGKLIRVKIPNRKIKLVLVELLKH